jgi:thiol:disulfide interchange protein DsbG
MRILSLTIVRRLWVVVAVMALSAGAAQAANPAQKMAASILEDIHQTTWIAEGKGPHVAYVFFDPNCPYCHKLYENTREAVKAGKLQLRWIPVGILLPTSHGKAVAMLGAEDPLKAFYQNEDNYTRGNGGLDEDLGTPEVEKKLSANEALLARTQLGAVPLMLFYTKQGEAVLIQGAPPKEKLPGILSYIK